MSAKPVIEEGERIRGGSPVNIPSPHVIACNALVLHQSEEDDLLRHIEKIREPTESIVEHDSEKRKVLTRHLLLTAGITSMILFGVVIGHEVILVGRPLTFPDALSGAIFAAVVAFGIESFIIVREQNL
jgi:hypothetical protein